MNKKTNEQKDKWTKRHLNKKTHRQIDLPICDQKYIKRQIEKDRGRHSVHWDKTTQKIDIQTNRQEDKQTNRQPEKQTYRQTDKKTNIQTDTQTRRQIDKHTNRHTDKKTNRQTDNKIF